MPKGHGVAGAEEDSRTVAETGVSWLNGTVTSGTPAAGSESTASTSSETLGQSLPKMASINECSTCHQKQFCIDCHGGVPMPHPADWKKTHGDLGKKNPESCQKCHGAGTTSCSSCHHGETVGWAYDPAIPWRQQHPAAVKAVGPSACTPGCHTPTYCAECHTNGGVPPK